MSPKKPTSGNPPAADAVSTREGFPPLMVDAQQRPIGEYWLMAERHLARPEAERLFHGFTLRDFWETSRGAYLVRIVPDPGLSAVKRLAFVSGVITAVWRTNQRPGEAG